MTENLTGDVLALIPRNMQRDMRHLVNAVAGVLTICGSVDDFGEYVRQKVYAVSMIPASLPAHDWWTLSGKCSLLWNRSRRSSYTR